MLLELNRHLLSASSNPQINITERTTTDSFSYTVLLKEERGGRGGLEGGRGTCTEIWDGGMRGEEGEVVIGSYIIVERLRCTVIFVYGLLDRSIAPYTKNRDSFHANYTLISPATMQCLRVGTRFLGIDVDLFGY